MPQAQQIAPATFETPAGSRHAIDYEAEAGPTVTARVQAFFGLDSHPSVAAGRLQVDITEGKIGPVPVPGPLLDQVETALAEGLTAGRDFSELTSVAVTEGQIAIEGTFQAQ